MDPQSLTSGLSSPEVQAFAAGFPTAVLHAVMTGLLLFGGATLYALLTPWKEIELIRQGNAAAGVAFGGVLVGLALPLAVSMAASHSLVEVAIWGVAALVIQLLSFRVVDAILTGLPQRIQEGEVSAAVLLVAAKLSSAVILAAAFSG